MKPTQIARLISEDTNFQGGIIAEEDIESYDIFRIPPQVLADMIEENGGKASDLQLIIRKCFDRFIPAAKNVLRLITDDEQLLHNTLNYYIRLLTSYDPTQQYAFGSVRYAYRHLARNRSKARSILADISNGIYDVTANLHGLVDQFNSEPDVAASIANTVNASMDAVRFFDDVIEYILPRIVDWNN